jgi:hypothetical protein
MGTLYDPLPSNQISNPNAVLTFNFNKVTIGGKDTSAKRVSNINSCFPGYDIYINSKLNVNDYALSSLQLISASNNITYYDTIINSTKQYKINFIHVVLSPINLKQTYCWCIMLDLISTALDVLIIIIPIKYLPLSTTDTIDKLAKNENSHFNTLLYNCNYSTSNQININKLMLPNNYSTIYNNSTSSTSKNRAIILNGSISTSFYDVINSSRTTFTTKYANVNYTNSEIYRTQSGIVTMGSFQQNQTYLCTKLPTQTSDILQNDIYIDCYKVGESDKISGGIKNPLNSASKNRKGNADTQIALFSIILSFTLLYAVWKLYKVFNQNKGSQSTFGRLTSMLGRSSTSTSTSGTASTTGPP